MTAIKKMPLEAVLFDLDGTLVDTAPDFILCIKKLCVLHGIDTPDEAIFRNQVSNGASAMIQTAFNISADDEKTPELITEFLAIYDENICVDSKLFDGLEKLINTLEKHNITWGIITNKPKRFAEPLVAALELNAACLVCPDHVSNRKPDPESMHLACSQLNLKAKNCIYVGDHRRDIESGHNANMHTIAAAYGYVDPKDPAGEWRADYYAVRAENILKIIETNFILDNQ